MRGLKVQKKCKEMEKENKRTTKRRKMMKKKMQWRMRQ
jgi:hypothetical protein